MAALFKVFILLVFLFLLVCYFQRGRIRGLLSVPLRDASMQNPITLDARGRLVQRHLSVGGGEMETSLWFVRKRGTGGLALAFPFGTSTCQLVLDDHGGEAFISGLERVYGRDVSSPTNPTSIRGRVIETDKHHQLKIVTLRGQILVSLDGKQLIDFRGTPKDITVGRFLKPSLPKEKVVGFWDGTFQVEKYSSRLVNFTRGIEVEELPAGTVTSVPGAGSEKESPKFAVSFGGALSFDSRRPLLDFTESFTIELWYRQQDLTNRWFRLLSGTIVVEFQESAWHSGKPQLGLGHAGGGTHGPLRHFDRNWHHIAVCNDGYYVELFLDGQFVCKLISAYFIGTEPALVRIGMIPSMGSKIHGFAGEVRDVRISNIVRYPRTQLFTPPQILGWDEHTRLRLDLATDPPRVRDDSNAFGMVTLRTKGVKFVPLDLAN